MRWVQFLNILLFLHYFAGHAVCQFTFENYSKDGYKNKYGANSANDSSRFYKPNSKCDYFNNSSSVLCHHQTIKNANYNYKEYDYYPVQLPVKNKYQYLHYGNYGGESNKNSFNSFTSSPLNPIYYQPVDYYTNNPNPYINIDPLRSRIEHSSSNHQEEQGHHKNSGHQVEHEPQEHHGTAWGWSKGHHNKDHKYVKAKKKKTKKGPLSKLLKKFKLKRKPEKLIWKEVSECDGWENFIKDLEIISWKLGWLGFKKATIGFVLHVSNQVYGFFSVYIVGIPERLTTFVDLIRPSTTPETLRTILAVIGLVDYFITNTLSYPLGNVIVLIELLAEVLTLASLALATVTIFDDLVEEKIWAIFGIDVRELFEGYGCDNPFDKQKKIEKFFEKLNDW